jgi:hypothetical protein
MFEDRPAKKDDRGNGSHSPTGGKSCNNYIFSFHELNLSIDSDYCSQLSGREGMLCLPNAYTAREGESCGQEEEIFRP